jgi:hypothetical protein
MPYSQLHHQLIQQHAIDLITDECFTKLPVGFIIRTGGFLTIQKRVDNIMSIRYNFQSISDFWLERDHELALCKYALSQGIKNPIFVENYKFWEGMSKLNNK